MSLTKVPQLLNSKTDKIYKSKKLNTANFGNFTHNDYQVFLHLVSKIGGVDKLGKYLQPEQLQREHVLTAKEFSEVFNADIHNSYKSLHKACKKLMKTSITIDKLELNETWEINVCSTAKYNKKEGRITIEFTDRIMPYLAQVKQKFVLYNLKEIANFRSLYTTRLYELIQEYKETGWMLKSLKQLRESLAVGSSFKLYGDFKRYTFSHACQEINDQYDMDMRFEEIKEGRKVVAVKFLFKKTLVHKVTNRKTGIEKNVYVKPKARIKKKKESIPEVLEGQLSFDDLKDDPTSMKSVMSSLLTKFFPPKK
jgi:plasmid replication initiation protein